MKIRIGLVASIVNHCNNLDSCIGFGISVRKNDKIRMASCGNLVVSDSQQQKEIAAFGFVLVK